MLELAIKYRDQLNQMQYNMWLNDKYKYWNNCSYYGQIQIDDDTWNRHQFVSVHNGEILGYISYNIARDDGSAHTLSIANFSENKVIFGKDLRQALEDIFVKYRFRKLSFTVVVGNPIERTYDKLIKKYGGEIVGIQKKEVKLMDGKYYDRKLYEIFIEDYFKVANYRGECRTTRAYRNAADKYDKGKSEEKTYNRKETFEHNWICTGRNKEDTGFNFICKDCGVTKVEYDKK